MLDFSDAARYNPLTMFNRPRASQPAGGDDDGKLRRPDPRTVRPIPGAAPADPFSTFRALPPPDFDTVEETFSYGRAVYALGAHGISRLGFIL
jgi:hypothetical protein